MDVAPYLGQEKPVIVVPRYRLEAWQASERMPNIFQDVFDYHGLREPPWGCWSAKRGAAADNIAFWVNRRRLKTGITKRGKRIYGEDLEEGKAYEIS